MLALKRKSREPLIPILFTRPTIQKNSRKVDQRCRNKLVMSKFLNRMYESRYGGVMNDMDFGFKHIHSRIDVPGQDFLQCLNSDGFKFSTDMDKPVCFHLFC